MDIMSGRLFQTKKDKRKPGRGMTEARRLFILERDGYVCAYCLGEASVVDHITPYDWVESSHEDNLVACCEECNAIASNKIFNSLQDKYLYIKSVREHSSYTRRTPAPLKIASCVDCGKTFKPRWKGSTVFLCSSCVARVFARTKRCAP